MKSILLVALILMVTSAVAQPPSYTPATDRMQAAQTRQNMIDQSRLKGIQFQSIGPTVMSGRVVDLDVNPTDPTHFFVAYASGGLWETRNNGQSFQALFDTEAVMTIGAIAVNWADTSIWIGTGEVNSSRSSYSGIGMYYSADQGETWEHKGLGDTQHIGQVIIHPQDPKTLWVASLGPLYTKDKGMRGVFKSSDAGETWQHVLNTGIGAVDMVIDAAEPEVLYAALWDRHREAWDFRGNGQGTGIYRSTDGGEQWTLMTGPESGFAQGDGLGRIGLAHTSEGGQSYLYAILDNQNRRPKEIKVEGAEGLKKEAFKDMSMTDFRSLDKEDVIKFLEKNKFPKAYTYEKVVEMMDDGDIAPRALYDYLSDANADLFDTPVIGAEIYRYTNDTLWEKRNLDYIDDFVYSYGYYFGFIEVKPGSGDEIYIGGVPLLYSSNGGQTFSSINPSNVHADHHAVWVNPERDGHLINGNDGGINISYDNGEHYINCNSPAVGQFYTVAVDDATPYNVYGGLQDNGVWKGPSTYRHSDAWHQDGDYPYKSLMGGDGMQIAIDPRDNETVYTGYQFGHYSRLKEGEASLRIHPKHQLGESPLRWNWQTPFKMSSHNPDILYMGSNRVHRSMDKGEHWEAISPDLSKGGIKGNVPFGTITSISESPFEFGQLIIGTDDGQVWITDSNRDWQQVGIGAENGIPQDYWVSRVIASRHDKDVYYLSLNGYRKDDMTALVFVSRDQGKTWLDLLSGTSFPDEPVNVILEDPVYPEILYIGTDHGLYVSLDSGNQFEALMDNLPHAPVHDMVIQEREMDLVVATHGRSLFKTDISLLHKTMEVASDLVIFEVDTLKHRDAWGEPQWSKWFGSYEPKKAIYWYTHSDANCTARVVDEKGRVYINEEWSSMSGLNRVMFDMVVDTEMAEKLNSKREEALKPAANGLYYLAAGSYELELYCGERSNSSTLLIIND